MPRCKKTQEEMRAYKSPVDEIDLLLHDAPTAILDSWRVVRGHLRRKSRPPSQTGGPLDEEPTKPSIPSASEHFRAAQDALKRSSE